MSNDTITLAHPVTVDGVKTTTLSMRRPKVRDLLAAEKRGGGEAEKEIRVFSHLCEVTPALVEELDLADYQCLQEKYKGFFIPALDLRGARAFVAHMLHQSLEALDALGVAELLALRRDAEVLARTLYGRR